MMRVPNVQNKSGKWRKCVTIEGKSVQTVSGSVWYDMNTRCLPNGSIQARQASYIGCTMSENFKDFQFFVEWHTSQIGYGLHGYELDKDILVQGNKIYSEDCCVLVPKELNMFAIVDNQRRGLWPPGVYLDKRRGTFASRLSVAGSYKYLGNFATPELAHSAYKEAKEKEGYRWYQRLCAGEFVVDQRVIDRMFDWQVPGDWN